MALGDSVEERRRAVTALFPFLSAEFYPLRV
jgi:hypothetical protein